MNKELIRERCEDEVRQGIIDDLLRGESIDRDIELADIIEAREVLPEYSDLAFLLVGDDDAISSTLAAYKKSVVEEIDAWLTESDVGQSILQDRMDSYAGFECRSTAGAT